MKKSRFTETQIVSILKQATVVLPWMISSTSADFRRAVQRLISSSIITLMGVSFEK